MKAVIYFQKRGPGGGEIEFDYDSEQETKIWVGVRAPDGLSPFDKAHVKNSVHRLVLNKKGAPKLK